MTLNQASTTSKIPAVGTDYIYGERAVTLEEAEQLARRRQQMYDCQRETYAAETNCRVIVAGTTFTIVNYWGLSPIEIELIMNGLRPHATFRPHATSIWLLGELAFSVLRITTHHQADREATTSICGIKTR